MRNIRIVELTLKEFKKQYKPIYNLSTELKDFCYWSLNDDMSGVGGQIQCGVHPFNLHTLFITENPYNPDEHVFVQLKTNSQFRSFKSKINY